MARVLDFNDLQDSLLDITLRDPDRTVVHLSVPTEALVDELKNARFDTEAMKKGDRAAVVIIYDLAARLINCNLDFFKTDARELETKYGMNMVLLLAFFKQYMASIEELGNIKN